MWLPAWPHPRWRQRLTGPYPIVRSTSSGVKPALSFCDVTEFSDIYLQELLGASFQEQEGEQRCKD